MDHANQRLGFCTTRYDYGCHSLELSHDNLRPFFFSWETQCFAISTSRNIIITKVKIGKLQKMEFRIHVDPYRYWFLLVLVFFFSFPLVITVLIVFYRFLRFLVAYY